VSNSSSIIVCVLVAAVTLFSGRCLATIGGYTYRHTHSWERFMQYAVKMSSGAIMYIPTFIKIDSGIPKWTGVDTQTNRQHGDLISLLIFFHHFKFW
jgi:hypothetical protein